MVAFLKILIFVPFSKIRIHHVDSKARSRIEPTYCPALFAYIFVLRILLGPAPELPARPGPENAFLSQFSRCDIYDRSDLWSAGKDA